MPTIARSCSTPAESMTRAVLPGPPPHRRLRCAAGSRTRARPGLMSRQQFHRVDTLVGEGWDADNQHVGAPCPDPHAGLEHRACLEDRGSPAVHAVTRVAKL